MSTSSHAPTPMPAGRLWRGLFKSDSQRETTAEAARAPTQFKDDNPAAAAAQRSSPVAKAKVSPAARRKAARKRTEDGQPVHSFRILLQDLANLTRNSAASETHTPQQSSPGQRPPRPAPSTPQPQDRRVGSTRSHYRVTPISCAQHSPRFGPKVSELVRSALGCPPSAVATRRLSRGPRSRGRQFDSCPGAVLLVSRR